MNYNIKVKRCSCCVMPEYKDVIKLDSSGMCSLCSERLTTEKLEQVGNESFDGASPEHKMQVFKKKVERFKTPGSKYDCAVAVSGGKDSIMTLYIARKQLGLNPLAIFIDNGFALEQMYENVRNASDVLGCDLVIFKSSEVAGMFRYLLQSGKNIYYCRVCHALLDLKINEICAQNDIKLVLGGYTKGQQYIRNSELFRIYEESDANTIELFEANPEFSAYTELFRGQTAYFRKHFPQIAHMSPFRYVEWNEEEILQTIRTELKFKLPERSWPDKSSNCSFNYVAQLLAMKQFGFAQHEAELSELVRKGELSRSRALEIIETPIETEDLERALKPLRLEIGDIISD